MTIVIHQRASNVNHPNPNKMNINYIKKLIDSSIMTEMIRQRTKYNSNKKKRETN